MVKAPSVEVRPGAHLRFIRRAREFSSGMEGALKDGQADLALSTAAHCVIAACDAILAFNMHRRSIASDHSRVAGMIEELELPGAPQKARQIEFVLSLMSAGEYDDREVTSAEVEKAVKMARRVLDWAEENLPRD